MQSEPPLVVIGAGFPRSGTTSTKVALNILFKNQGHTKTCHHMLDVFMNNEHQAWADLYKRGWDKEKNNIMTLLHEKYMATIDIPSMMFWKELLALNPGAKILLTVRDSFDQWYQSMMDTVYSAYKLQSRVPPWVHLLGSRIKHMATILGGTFGKAGLFQGRFEDKEFATGVYDAFIEDVKRTVPPDQLLVFNVKEGWVPLCKFLNVPVPDVPFPHVNNTNEFNARQIPPLREKVRLLTYRPLLVAGLGSAALLVAVRLITGRRR